MRISDWSSDVCSSDLSSLFLLHVPRAVSLLVADLRLQLSRQVRSVGVGQLLLSLRFRGLLAEIALRLDLRLGRASVNFWEPEELGRASCRERVCKYG